MTADPLAALLHDLYVSGPPYGCDHDPGIFGDPLTPRCDEDAARLHAAGVHGPEDAGPRHTHGRHCRCSACARQDWTLSYLAPCGMHGPSCPAEYQPESHESWEARNMTAPPSDTAAPPCPVHDDLCGPSCTAREEMNAEDAAPLDVERLRKALADLLWWADYVADPDEDKDSKDLADTDEEAERRWQLLNTLNDRSACAVWLRSRLSSEVAGSSGSASTLASAPSGSPSPASGGRPAPPFDAAALTVTVKWMDDNAAKLAALVAEIDSLHAAAASSSDAAAPLDPMTVTHRCPACSRPTHTIDGPVDPAAPPCNHDWQPWLANTSQCSCCGARRDDLAPSGPAAHQHNPECGGLPGDPFDRDDPAAPLDTNAPHPGESHSYRMTCTRCGEPGYLFVGYHSAGEGFTWTGSAALAIPAPEEADRE